MVILGLCEGNHCSETQKNDRGNGQIVVMRKGSSPEGECQWNTVKMINVPSSAYFKDYSALTATKSGKIGISSQEDSQFWVGQLLGQNKDGLWDVNAMEFDASQGKLIDFPKNDSCETVYCNIEGVHWINDGKMLFYAGWFLLVCLFLSFLTLDDFNHHLSCHFLIRHDYGNQRQDEVQRKAGLPLL